MLLLLLSLSYGRRRGSGEQLVPHVHQPPSHEYIQCMYTSKSEELYVNRKRQVGVFQTRIVPVSVCVGWV